MTDKEIKALLERELPGLAAPGEQVLLVVPDTTRTAPIARLFQLLYPVLRGVGVRIDVLVALGTHPPLPDAVLRRHLGLDGDRAAAMESTRILNHAWDDPGQLMRIGELSADEVARLSGNLLAERVQLRVNRMVGEVNRVLVLNAVFPHELVGFSGGSKYLFPGISGPEMIDVVHWLGALRTSLRTIGRIDTPGRRVLDAAAARMPVPAYGVSFACQRGEVVAMEVGELAEAWRRIAAVSQQLHVTRKPHPFRKVLAGCPGMYPDLWTGGKCMYKCEPVVEDGGELIIYAPHVRCFSEVHNAAIARLGYHVRDYFLAHMDRYADASRAVMAYCSLVKGAGTYADGVEHARIRVSFASQIARETCEAAGIGCVDPATIDPAEWRGREDEGILFVERAGEMLYRISQEAKG